MFAIFTSSYGSKQIKFICILYHFSYNYQNSIAWLCHIMLRLNLVNIIIHAYRIASGLVWFVHGWVCCSRPPSCHNIIFNMKYGSLLEPLQYYYDIVHQMQSYKNLYYWIHYIIYVFVAATVLCCIAIHSILFCHCQTKVLD